LQNRFNASRYELGFATQNDPIADAAKDVSF
jgi:hypothetical protein